MDILNTDFYSQISHTERDQLSSISSTRFFQAKEFLYQPDNHTNHVYILIAGRVKIYELSDSGKETILWFCFPGEIFGIADIFQKNGRKIYAETCTKTEVLCIQSQQFDFFLSNHHHISMYIIKLLSHRMRTLADMLLNRSSDDVSTRLVKLLYQFAVQYGNLKENYYSLDLKLTHQELGDMIGASRQTISSTLSNLSRSGLIAKSRDNIRVHCSCSNSTTGISQHEH